MFGYRTKQVLKTAFWSGIATFIMTASTMAIDISQYPTVKHPEKFSVNWTEFYHTSIAQTAATQKEFPHNLDLAYGTSKDQRLDIYLPKGKVENAPVLLFLHGGGFVEGDKAIYGFVAKPYVEHGIVTAIASYRLTTGGSHYPDQADDAEKAIIWLYEHVAKYGGDPNSLYVSGHSAGAIITADISVDRSWLARAGIPAGVLKGAFPVSATYDIQTFDGLENYAPTPTLRYAASPLFHITNPVPHFVVGVGEKEDKFLQPSKDFTAALVAQGSASTLVVCKDKDHRGAVEDFANADSELFAQVLKVIKGN